MVPKTPVPANVVRKSSVLNCQISVNYKQTFERSKDVKIPLSSKYYLLQTFIIFIVLSKNLKRLEKMNMVLKELGICV